MGVNKVVYGAVSIIDITDSTVTPETMFDGTTAYGADGEKVTGTFTVDSEITEQESLIAELSAVLDTKAAGGGESKTTVSVTVTANGNTVYYFSEDGTLQSTTGIVTVDALHGVLYYLQAVSTTCTGTYVRGSLNGVQVFVFLEDGGTMYCLAGHSGGGA